MPRPVATVVMLAGLLLNGCATDRDARLPPTPVRPFIVPETLLYGNLAAAEPAPRAEPPGGPGIDAAKFEELAQAAKKGCPISRALASVPSITMTAKFA